VRRSFVSLPPAAMTNLKVDSESCWALWQDVRKAGPLVQCITNFVSMDIMANVLLAAGCSPAMVSHAAVRTLPAACDTLMRRRTALTRSRSL
jgi:hypothetical protein